MQGFSPLTDATTLGGFLLVLAIMLPATGVLLALLAGGRQAERIALAILPVGLIVSLAIAALISHTGQSLGYAFGGWAPPLGVALRADGFSAVMLVAVVQGMNVIAKSQPGRQQLHDIADAALAGLAAPATVA